jgi:hypothetical protein
MELKRKIKIATLVGIAFIFMLIFFDSNITGNAISINQIASNIPLSFFLIFLAGLFLILSLDLIIPVSQEEKSKNLEAILSKGNLNINQLVAVRAVSNGKVNIQGNKIYAGPLRPTVHFSLNGLADINPIYGNWNGADTVILAPFKELIEANKQNFYGGSTVDVFTVGYANLPKDTIILKRDQKDSDQDFKNKVNAQIKKMGYKVLPAGDWAWGGSLEATKQFVELLRPYGFSFGAHSGTVFGVSDDRVFSIASGQLTKSRPVQKMYMMQTIEKSGLQLYDGGIGIDKKTSKLDFPSLERFYKLMEKNNPGKIARYEDWLKIQLESGDISPKPDSKKINSKLIRDLYNDYLREAVKSGLDYFKKEASYKKKELTEYQQRVKDWRKEVKNVYKDEGKDSEKLKELEFEGERFNRSLDNRTRDYIEAKNALEFRRKKAESSKYTGFVNVWNSYWTRQLNK